MADWKAAVREANQEAGVQGRVVAKSCGEYAYRKTDATGSRLTTVTVFILWVHTEKKRWREKHERVRIWLDLLAASKRVREPRLKSLLTALANSRSAKFEGIPRSPAAPGRQARKGPRNAVPKSGSKRVGAKKSTRREAS